MEERSGNRPLALDGPDLPPDAEHIWGWFLELHAARGSNGFGMNPITFEAVLAWTTLTGTIIRPAEVRAIQALDRVWLSSVPKGEEMG